MGSKVIRGNLLMIPVEDSLVYVEPLYLRPEQGQIPQLKRVVVAYNDRLATVAPHMGTANVGAPPDEVLEARWPGARTNVTAGCMGR